MKLELSKSHQRTYDAFFQHPIARNLHWRDVRSLLSHIGVVTEHPEGQIRITSHHQSLSLYPGQAVTLDDAATVIALRHFLERLKVEVEFVAPAPARILVVLDHREARVYTAQVHGSTPVCISPEEGEGHGRGLHENEEHGSGQRKPEVPGYYEAIARALQAGNEIVLFGAGTGASSAMEGLMAHLERQHPDIAAHVVTRQVLDEHHLSEDQLLAKARGLFEAGAMEVASVARGE